MLFTNIQLDDFKGVLSRLEEKLLIEGELLSDSYHQTTLRRFLFWHLRASQLGGSPGRTGWTSDPAYLRSLFLIPAPSIKCSWKRTTSPAYLFVFLYFGHKETKYLFSYPCRRIYRRT